MRLRILSLAAFLTVSSASLALAQASLDIDPSIRSAGMGGASGAVHWGGDGNYWANPALLGYTNGFRYEYGTTNLVPDLAEGASFKTSRFSAGSGGIGFAIADRPDGSGYIHLNYGYPVGSPPVPTDREEVSMLAIGASLSGLVNSACSAAGEGTPDLFKYVDVAAGYAEKDVLVHLGNLPEPGKATGKDWGVLGRFTIPIPIDASARTGPVRIEGSYGHSVSNYNDDAVLAFPGLDAPPLLSTTRDAGALRCAIGLPRQYRKALKKKDLRWLERGLQPYLSLGVMAQRDETGGYYGYEVNRWGTEATLANMVSFRYGHIDDDAGDIHGNTWGIGVGFDVGFAGFRYDHAEIPQAEGLSRVTREGWTAYIDPIAAMRLLR